MTTNPNTPAPLSPQREAEIRGMRFTTGLNAACGHFDTPVERELYNLAVTNYNARLQVLAELDRTRTERVADRAAFDGLAAVLERTQTRLADCAAERDELTKRVTELEGAATGTEYAVRADGKVMEIRTGHGREQWADDMARTETVERAGRYRDCWPDAVLVQRTVRYGEWAEVR